MAQNKIFKSIEGEKLIFSLYDKTLEQWPVPYESLFIDTKLAKTHLLICGDKDNPPLILFHGSGGNAVTWMESIKNYAAQFRVYIVDIPGEPGKSEQKRFSFTGDSFNLWLDSLLDCVNVNKAVLAGVSLGGWATLKYTVARPQKVKALILISNSGVIKPKPDFLLKSLFYAFQGEQGLRKLVKTLYCTQNIPEEIIFYFKIMSEHYIYRKDFPPLFSDEDLKKIALPVLFLGGGKDVMIDCVATAERLKKNLPDLIIKIYPEEGHALLDKSKEIIDFIMKIK